MGRLSSKKGLFTLLLAFRDVVKEIPEAKLKLAGKGKLKGVLKSLCKTLGIDKNVDFLGYVPDERLNALFSSADIFVLPSSFGESFGIVILEAMASGTPVIGTEVGGIEEILEGGKYGVLVPPLNPSALAESMISLMRDEKRRRALRKNGIERVRKAYDWRLVSRKVMDVYEKPDVP